MKTAPTLIDTLYRSSFRNVTPHGWRSNALWREILHKAKRFVLDDAMSTFLGELATQAFIQKGAQPIVHQGTGFTARDTLPNIERKMEHLRMASRLPSETVWIEYNLRNCQRRVREVTGQPLSDRALLEIPAREGWLLQRHPHLDCAFRLQIISHDPDVDHGDGFDTWAFPCAMAWTADMDTVMPWRDLFRDNMRKDGVADDDVNICASELSTGILQYISDRIAYVESPLVDVSKFSKDAMVNLLQEWCGTLRRVFALLATINDLPVEIKDVRASKGFIGKHQYRKFLDHKTITLTVPVTQYTKIARQTLATVHRRGGPVREHWRNDFRRPLSALCEHDFTADEKHMNCTLCKGRKIWVIEHVRGDTSRGFVTHDFKVTHEEQHR